MPCCACCCVTVTPTDSGTLWGTIAAVTAPRWHRAPMGAPYLTLRDLLRSLWVTPIFIGRICIYLRGYLIVGYLIFNTIYLGAV